MVVAPHLDGLFIALAGAAFWFLSTVLDGREEARAMGRMIAHAKLALDHLSNSRGGPDLPAKPERFGSSRQQFWQLSHLLWSQLRWGTRRGMVTQPFFPLCFATADPLAHRSFGDPEGSRDVFLLPSLFVQFPRAQASPFAPIFGQRCGCFHPSLYRLLSLKL